MSQVFWLRTPCAILREPHSSQEGALPKFQLTRTPRIWRPKVEAMASPCADTKMRPTNLPSTRMLKEGMHLQTNTRNMTRIARPRNAGTEGKSTILPLSAHR